MSLIRSQRLPTAGVGMEAVPERPPENVSAEYAPSEHELPLEDGLNLAMLNQHSVFNARALADSSMSSGVTPARQALVLQ